MNIPFILANIRPQSEWLLNGDEYDGLIWLDGTDKPSLAELQDAWVTLESELSWVPIRQKRDQLLARCDWTQVADAPVDSSVWAAYRQALRDVPQDFDSPESVVWPEQP